METSFLYVGYVSSAISRFGVDNKDLFYAYSHNRRPSNLQIGDLQSLVDSLGLWGGATEAS